MMIDVTGVYLRYSLFEAACPISYIYPCTLSADNKSVK